MALLWTWLGVYQTAVTLVSIAVAALVLLPRPDRFQNQSLALVLILFGVMGFGSQGLIQLTDDASLAYASQALLYAPGAAVSFVYLAFVGTLPTPLARPFGGRVARRVLLILAALAGVAATLTMPWFVADLTRDPGTDLWYARLGPLAFPMWYAVASVVLYGFLATLSMARRAPPGGPLRKQALIFATAFGVRDAWYVGTLLLAIAWVEGAPWQRELVMYQFPSLTLFVTALLAYGALRYQLFDIDLKIKWTISRGTVAATFVAVFFFVSELAASFLSGLFGTVLGLGAAALLLFALAPMQRFADRVSDKAMPNVRDTAEYRMVRKSEVYRAAVESALQDGRVTDKERDVLATLAQELGLGPKDALAIERQVVTVR